MPRRRRLRNPRIRARARSIFQTIRRRAPRGKGGLFGLDGLVPGLISGALGIILARTPVGQWSDKVADIGVGYFMGNETLLTIGGRSLGQQLISGGLTQINGGATTTGILQ